MNRWLLALFFSEQRDGTETAITVKILPIRKSEERIAVELLAEEGAHCLYTLTREVELSEVEAVLSVGGSINKTFTADIETFYPVFDETSQPNESNAPEN